MKQHTDSTLYNCEYSSQGIVYVFTLHVCAGRDETVVERKVRPTLLMFTCLFQFDSFAAAWRIRLTIIKCFQTNSLIERLFSQVRIAACILIITAV